ncbi:MAG: F0F1 ATP synthase subunit alpha, partial [Clostridia bacterium]|nr:F0F1 ATP synthase subunit alpha [Clostridia bacterium]
YIPTNVISITDGQIFLDTELFREGMRPAVSGGLSVSRVGGAAQEKAMRKVSGQLRLELAQYRELQVFAQFSSDMDESTQDMLRYGGILSELLKQKNDAPLSMPVQVALLYAATRGILSHMTPIEEIRAFKKEFPAYLTGTNPHVVHSLQKSGELPPEAEEELVRAIRGWEAEYLARQAADAL